MTARGAYRHGDRANWDGYAVRLDAPATYRGEQLLEIYEAAENMERIEPIWMPGWPS